MELENKFDVVFEEYNRMMSLQTSWKAECQLYEYAWVKVDVS
jgi:hypothetical protein